MVGLAPQAVLQLTKGSTEDGQNRISNMLQSGLNALPNPVSHPAYPSDGGKRLGCFPERRHASGGEVYRDDAFPARTCLFHERQRQANVVQQINIYGQHMAARVLDGCKEAA